MRREGEGAESGGRREKGVVGGVSERGLVGRWQELGLGLRLVLISKGQSTTIPQWPIIYDRCQQLWIHGLLIESGLRCVNGMRLWE